MNPLFATESYIVVTNPEEDRINGNYAVTNKKTGCIEVETQTLPAAMETCLMIQEKLDIILDSVKETDAEIRRSTLKVAKIDKSTH